MYLRTRWYRLMIFIVSTEIPSGCFHLPAVDVVVTADGVWDWTATIRSVVHLTASCLLWALCIRVWTNNIRRRLEKTLSLQGGEHFDWKLWRVAATVLDVTGVSVWTMNDEKCRHFNFEYFCLDSRHSLYMLFTIWRSDTWSNLHLGIDF